MNTLLSVNARDIELPASVEQWLYEIKQPMAITVDGEDNSKVAIVSVLIHGNEPSGFYGLFEFLQQQIKPKMKFIFVISSVQAAQLYPLFSHRVVPGTHDLNRRFGKAGSDAVTARAAMISQFIKSQSPELIVDLHNTSGHSPAFAVTTSNDYQLQRLAGVFTNTVIVTHLVVGSLMEQPFGCPVVTIECGGAQQLASHKLAYDGLTKLAELPSVNQLPDTLSIVHEHPSRVL
ncbi:MAG: succinylglutamate desuccinylase/aspartoacylase family protein, partial [Kangiellaceae bacterium]|nr:succinylglutamate desuccinylase/aspartoacylase family protein [Kangiellaceae bacterium]